jgi:hypothetical protein
MGIGGKLLEEQNALLEEQNKIIREEMRGLKGITEHGQPSIHSVRFYESLLEAFEKLERTLPKHIVESAAFQEVKARRSELLELRRVLERGGGQFKDPKDQERFDELRTRDLMAQGLHRERAEAHVEWQNRQFERSRRLHDMQRLEEERDGYVKERAELSKWLRPFELNLQMRFGEGARIREAQGRRDELTAKINEANQGIASQRRELNRFNRSDPMVQRQTRGIDADFMERVFRSTFGGGSFSAYDIMRGGIDRNDPMLHEARVQTNLLRSIDDKVGGVGEMGD